MGSAGQGPEKKPGSDKTPPLRHRPTRTCDADAHKTKRRSRSTTQDCLRIPWAHSTATAIFWPDVQWAPTWHAKYTVPAVSSWASYTLA
eukprot:scaffold1011_cov57-Phaeocystis_antarctica.AAC.1